MASNGIKARTERADDYDYIGAFYIHLYYLRKVARKSESSIFNTKSSKMWTISALIYSILLSHFFRFHFLYLFHIHILTTMIEREQRSWYSGQVSSVSVGIVLVVLSKFVVNKLAESIYMSEFITFIISRVVDAH